MSDFLKVLSHARRLKAATEELAIDALEEVVDKLQKIIDDRRNAEEEEKKQNAERLAKIEEYRKMLEADGIDLSELGGATESAKPRAKRPPRPAKYEYWNDQGERLTWTGQGRMPKILQEKTQSGQDLSEFLIK